MYMRRGLNYITQANVKHRAQNGIDGFLEIIFSYFELNYKSNCHRSQWLLLRVLVAIFITNEPFRLYLIRDKLLVWIAISFEKSIWYWIQVNAFRFVISLFSLRNSTPTEIKEINKEIRKWNNNNNDRIRRK